MVQCVHYGGAICAENMHTEVEYRRVYEVAPSSTNMREFAPPKSDIPAILVTQSVAVEYSQECMILPNIVGCV